MLGGPVIPALLSSLAYSSDAIFGKFALNKMNMFVFTFLLSLTYAVLSIFLFIMQPKQLWQYITDKRNHKPIGWAILAIVIGTIIADIFMWYAIKTSSKMHLPITVSLIHTVPVFSLLLVYLIFKTRPNNKAVLGIFLIVIGSIIAVYYGEEEAA